MKHKFLLLAILLLLSIPRAFSQYKWWNDLHNWDGCTNWYYYLKMTPRYFGPNALPVPRVSPGRLSTDIRLEGTAAYHFSKGDHTQNLKGRLYWPLSKGRAAIEVSGVPLEHYRMDSATRDERVARDYDGEGYASGDVHVSSYFQILQDHNSWPDILLRVYLRAPSGNNAEAARFTDTPGYAFDLSTQKTWQLQPHTRLKWFIMAGLYFWQTNTAHKQNDAYLYGTGLQLRHRQTTINGRLAGYSGYFNNGDHPVVVRGSLEQRFTSRFAARLSLQHGLHDFLYTTVRISGLLYLQPEAWAKKSGG